MRLLSLTFCTKSGFGGVWFGNLALHIALNSATFCQRLVQCSAVDPMPRRSRTLIVSTNSPALLTTATPLTLCWT